MFDKDKIKEIISFSSPAVISMVIIFFITYPTISYIQDIKEKITEQHRDLEIKYQNAKQLKKNSEKINQLQDKLVVLDDIFVKQEQELGFITTLENIATKNNIDQKINLIKATPKTSTSKATSKTPPEENMGFDINASGSYKNILAWLLEIEQLTYYINFESLNINTTSTEINNTSENITIKLIGKVYTTKI
jgi:hypothetical protein